MGAEPVKHTLKVFRAVGPIHIHFTDDLVIMQERPFKTRDICRPQPALDGPVDNEDAPVLLRHFFCQLPRTIRGRIIHHKDMGIRAIPEYTLKSMREVILFVICRHNDNRPRPIRITNISSTIHHHPL